MDSETVILHKSFPNPQKEPMSLTDLISIYPPMKATNFFGLQAFYAQPDPDIVTSAPGYTVLNSKQQVSRWILLIRFFNQNRCIEAFHSR